MTRLEKRTLIISLAIFFSLLAFIFLYPFPDTSGYFRTAGGQELSLGDKEPAGVPQQVKDDAYEVAVELLGEDDSNLDRLVQNLCATYATVTDTDVLIIFNSGGFGWSVIEDSSGWGSIVDAMEELLADNGYTSTMVDYQRTEDSIIGAVSEATATAGHLWLKGQNLALMADFLSKHLPQTSIILVGESNGTVICDKTLRNLADNPNIYTIQTGPPCWYVTLDTDRSLVIRDNGLIPDAFSNGDLISIVRANLETIIGIEKVYEGDVLNYIGAPGHIYSWKYPNVEAEITDFINLHFN